MAAAAVRFVHLADVHLGFRQYGLAERAEDFARAFASVVDYCLHTAPDFVVIAGDLFDSKSIDPQTYAAADAQLERLARAGIPTAANEGNHERWFRRGDRSWLWQLSRHGRLRLLRQFDPSTGALLTDPWTSERGYGAYTDIGAARVYGVEYLGARLGAHLPEISAALAAAPPGAARCTVGVLHTGVDDVLDHGGAGVTLRDLAPLRDVTDYLALGHVHYAYQLPHADSWVFNPGALEAHNLLEGLMVEPAGGPGRARGIYDVRLTPGAPASIDARLRDDVIQRRPFQRLDVNVSGLTDVEQLCAAVAEAAARAEEPDGPPPVVELRLSGRLGFERVRLDTERLQRIVADIRAPLHVRVTVRLGESGGPISAAEHAASLHSIERDVVQRLVQASPRAAQAQVLTEAALQLKAAAVEGRPAEDMAAYLERRLR